MTSAFSGLVHLVLIVGAIFLLVLIVSIIFKKPPASNLEKEINDANARISLLEVEMDQTKDPSKQKALYKEQDALKQKRSILKRQQASHRYKREPRDNSEILMRGVGAITGLLLYLGARTAGISIPELAFSAMSTSFPVAVALGGVLLPSLAGLIVCWFVIRHISGKDAARDRISLRVLSMILSVVFLVYCDTYLYAFSANASTIHYVPTLVFALSILLYAIFRYHPHQSSGG